MRHAVKLVVVSAFFCLGMGLVLTGSAERFGRGVEAKAAPTATPEPANTAPASPAAPGKPAGDKALPEKFTLAQDSKDENGPVAFNHDNHAFKTYSVDGKTTIACIECHHTDQPKAALKPPLKTSERDVELTLDVWKKSDKKVSTCRTCHFQENEAPEGKEQPSATYTEGGKSVTKELTNELAYHINCNTCHDAAAKARPELVGKKTGFATAKQCLVCHTKN